MTGLNPYCHLVLHLCSRARIIYHIRSKSQVHVAQAGAMAQSWISPRKLDIRLSKRLRAVIRHFKCERVNVSRFNSNINRPSSAAPIIIASASREALSVDLMQFRLLSSTSWVQVASDKAIRRRLRPLVINLLRALGLLRTA